jgi:outer membrane protein assembly factor BamB
MEVRVMGRRWAWVAVGALIACAGADWRQFRGTDSRGVSAESVPERFGPDQNIAWKVDLPDRGVSSPIVVGDRVFVTASGGAQQDRLHVLAFDAKSGRKLWQRAFWATGPTASHPKTCMAAPTPASDGRHVVALFATNDMVCLDLDGNVEWVRSLYEENPGATDGRGLASSPIIADSTVVVLIENQNKSFAAGIDLVSGANRWRMDRPRQPDWATPIVLPGGGGRTIVLLQGVTRLSACDVATGKEVWQLEQKSHPIASSVVEGNMLIVPGEDDLWAFELQGASPPRALWHKPKLNPAMASPVVLGDCLYALRGTGISAGDVKTGEVKGQLRLQGQFSSSAVAAGGLIYCFSEAGTAQVIRPGAKDPTLVASCPLGETILATPAIADGAMYVRSDKHLWKIAKP